MNRRGNTPLNKQIYEEASEWLVALRVDEVDAPARERLDSWFRESPHHIRAFLELSSIWEDANDPDLDHGNSTDALIAKARATTNVVPLEQAGADNRKSSKGSARLSWRSVLVASLLIALFAGGFAALQRRSNPTYATAIGEQKMVHLPDGSLLTLNSRSRIRVRFSAHERDVDLLEGQALFQVAKDPARPFVVQCDSTRVRAVGTQFDVYRKESGTIVTVVEGLVAVLPVQVASGSAAVEMTQVSTGEQVTVTHSKVTQPALTDVAAVTAWTHRELVFDSTPLADVVQEFNRYNARQMIVSDPSLKNLHVTGLFSSTDPASLLSFLRAQQGVSVEEAGGQVRISNEHARSTGRHDE
jgi:transmembrane sensor